MHICVFTTVHPWDDVRVKSKFVDSFLAAGDSVTWVGPNRAFFETEAERDQRIQYKLVERGPGWKGRIASMRSLRTLLAETTDIDWIYTPDPDAAAIALSIRHTRVVLDLHEEYHKGHMTQSLPSPLRQLGEAAIQLTIGVIARRCALVTAVNDAILDAYRADPKRRLATFNTPPEWFTRAEM